MAFLKGVNQSKVIRQAVDKNVATGTVIAPAPPQRISLKGSKITTAKITNGQPTRGGIISRDLQDELDLDALTKAQKITLEKQNVERVKTVASNNAEKGFDSTLLFFGLIGIILFLNSR